MSDLCNLAHLPPSPVAIVTRTALQRSVRTHKSHDLPLSFSFQTAVRDQKRRGKASNCNRVFTGSQLQWPH